MKRDAAREDLGPFQKMLAWTKLKRWLKNNVERFLMEAKSMSNTQLRVISAIGLLLILVAAFVLGREASLILIGIVGVLVLDEFVCNFLEFSRRHVSYVLSLIHI